jgi:lysine 6-dehydrogenase
MKVVVIGAGLMGPTIVKDCIESDDVEDVLVIDIDKSKLDNVRNSIVNISKLKTGILDVTDKEALVDLLKGYDVATIALLRPLNINAIWGSINAGVNVVDLSSPHMEQYDEINEAALKAGVIVIGGCGVEPGLTEILSTHGMDNLDNVESVELWCGGIPEDPRPPLEYKIVFGGPYLPLRPGKVKIIKDGEVGYVDRYELAETVSFEGIDRPLEAFYDGFPETLYQIDKFKNVKKCSEVTVRYKGYCDKVKFLDACGLLSRESIIFEGQEIDPFEVFSKIIHPKVKLEEGEHDITVLKVKVEGKKDGLETSYIYDMVDRYDAEKQVTSMAKTTSYTAAIVARMIGLGEIHEKGYVGAGKAVRGELVSKLIQELDKRNVNIKQTYKQDSN